MAERFEVEISKAAEKDIKGVIHYLMTNYSHTSAVRAVRAINDKIASLKTFPESKPIFHKDSSKAAEVLYRYAIAKKVHRIIFTIEIERNLVIVAKIKHVKADKANVIRSLEEE